MSSQRQMHQGRSTGVLVLATCLTVLSRDVLADAPAAAKPRGLTNASLAGVPAKTTLLARIDASFSLPGFTGNPFDYVENDVRVTIAGPGGRSIQVPAFFDGGALWRVRFQPAVPGRYTLAKFLRNGHEVKPAGLSQTAFLETGSAGPGFIRRDPGSTSRFVFDNGDTYYPIGNDAAWGKGDDDSYLLGILDKMGGNGHENWARIWMNHWDGKNLDWQPGLKGQFGQLDLSVARRWDAIVDNAERNRIYVQMTLQHHGPYSSKVDSNWGENPWNVKNGGFLATPTEFFTSPRAIALTKAKYRYIIARWGYSPNIFAWEIFNEVQWCDPIPDKHPELVTNWHREMAAFIRQQDPFHHLVTTSSDTHIPHLYDEMDFSQPHAYQDDAVTTVTATDPVFVGKPYFFGEIGPAGKSTPARQKQFLHDALWASLMSPSAGSAQFWYWDQIDPQNLYGVLRAASDFVTAVGPNVVTSLEPVSLNVSTPDAAGAVSAGPSGGWSAAKQTDFVVSESGDIPGIGALPSYLQGKAHQDMFAHADFHVDFKTHPGTFTVGVKQVAPHGGHLVLLVDGQMAAEKDFPAVPGRDQSVDAAVTAAVSAGKHVVRIENTGDDWVVASRITLAPYGSALKALGKIGPTHAILWVRRASGGASDAPVSGTIEVPGLKPGRYVVRWWDTSDGHDTGEATQVTVAAGHPFTITTPTISKDAAVRVYPAR